MVQLGGKCPKTKKIGEYICVFNMYYFCCLRPKIINLISEDNKKVPLKKIKGRIIRKKKGDEKF